MSALAILGIFCSVVFLGSMICAGICMHTSRASKKPYTPSPEVGTIRIIEKKRDAGTEYYTPEYYTGYGWMAFTANREGEDWDYIESDTVAGCQEEVDEELERQKNKAHSKAMGEFKP